MVDAAALLRHRRLRISGHLADPATPSGFPFTTELFPHLDTLCFFLLRGRRRVFIASFVVFLLLDVPNQSVEVILCFAALQISLKHSI